MDITLNDLPEVALRQMVKAGRLDARDVCALTATCRSLRALRPVLLAAIEPHCARRLQAASGAHLAVTSLAWLPGRHQLRLAAGCRDGVLRLWDVQTGQLLQHKPSEVGSIWCMAAAVYSPEATPLIAVGGGTGCMGLWWPDRAGSAEQPRYVMPGGSSAQADRPACQCLALSRDGLKLVVGTASGALVLCHTTEATGMVTQRHDRAIRSIAIVGEQQRRAVAVDASGTLSLWAIDGFVPECLQLLLGPAETLCRSYRMISGAALKMNPNLFAAAGSLGVAQVWALQPTQNDQAQPGGRSDKSQAQRTSEEVRLWAKLKTDTGESAAASAVSSSSSVDETATDVEDISFSPDGRWVACCSQQRGLQCWEPANHWRASGEQHQQQVARKHWGNSSGLSREQQGAAAMAAAKQWSSVDSAVSSQGADSVFSSTMPSRIASEIPPNFGGHEPNSSTAPDAPLPTAKAALHPQQTTASTAEAAALIASRPGSTPSRTVSGPASMPSTTRLRMGWSPDSRQVAVVGLRSDSAGDDGADGCSRRSGPVIRLWDVVGERWWGRHGMRDLTAEIEEPEDGAEVLLAWTLPGQGARMLAVASGSQLDIWRL